LDVAGEAYLGGLSTASRFLVTGNQIQQYANGTPADMNLNYNGGNVYVRQKPAAVGEEVLRIVRGTVAANGSTIAGSGFTAINTSVGFYTITFSPAFTGIPTVTANSSQDANVARVSVATANSFTVNLHTPTIGNYNVPFSFIAIGPR
jgi:hypothetical protein